MADDPPGPLRVYLVERGGAGPGGCRAYLVFAESEDRAIWYCPAGGLPTADVLITELGTAGHAGAPGVLRAWFNAG
jgi:hypothetical protein